MTEDSHVIYKVVRAPERRIFTYRGYREIDVGHFYCPYVPGMTPTKQEVYAYAEWRSQPETEYQRALFWSIKEQPMLGKYRVPSNKDR